MAQFTYKDTFLFPSMVMSYLAIGIMFLLAIGNFGDLTNVWLITIAGLLLISSSFMTELTWTTKNDEKTN